MPIQNKRNTKFRAKKRVILPIYSLSDLIRGKLNVPSREIVKYVTVNGKKWKLGMNRVTKKGIVYMINVFSNHKAEYKVLGFKEERLWREVSTKQLQYII